MSTSEYDVGLFETITGLIREQQTASRQNRRAASRHQFECVQLLAPYDGETLPALEDFRHVLCHDISRSGLSFLAHEKPETNRVVVALGKIPPSFFVAEILHICPTVTSSGHEYQIGCRFLHRLGDAS